MNMMNNNSFCAAWLRGALTPAVFFDRRTPIIAFSGIIISQTAR